MRQILDLEKRFIAERVKRIRKNLGVKQKELAESIGISAASLCQKENGNRSFNAEELGIIAQQLRVNPTDFYSDVN